MRIKAVEATSLNFRLTSLRILKVDVSKRVVVLCDQTRQWQVDQLQKGNESVRYHKLVQRRAGRITSTA